MITTILKVMALSLLRDRGALIMTFVLPPAIYLVFAAIFSGSGQGDPDLRVGLLTQAEQPALTAALSAMPKQTLQPYDDRALMELELAEGRLDAALIVQGPITDLSRAPLLVLADPGKLMAGSVLVGRLREMLSEEQGAALLARQADQVEAVTGPFTPDQARRIEAAVAAGPDPGAEVPLVAQAVVGGDDEADPSVTYYAAGIAIMFLLLSATQTAAGLIDDRRSGILDRFAASPGGIEVVVLGRSLFIALQALAQATLVFAVAALAYQVPVLEHLWVWLLATLVVAVSVAGIGIFSAAVCSTRAQAQTGAIFLILTFSAIGGSMVPRFLMPDWLRDIGVISPNAWVIELYQGLLTRDLSLGEVWVQIAALLALALVGTAAAVKLSQWRLQL
ncbi:MAG: ABC transporter permease [Pseudomonadota bacterium]